MAEYIERTEELMLAMNAGARAIENTRRYHGAIYTKDVFLESPQKIPYLQAAKVLREVSDAPAADVAPVRWQPVFGYEGLYEVNQFGQIRNKDGKIMRQRLKKAKYTVYKKVSLYKNGKYKHLYVHRIVAQAFIPNPQCFDLINHKDEDGTNNVVDNLEWFDRSYNATYGTSPKKISKAFKGRESEKRIAVYAINKSGDSVGEWDSIAEAAKDVGCSTSEISGALKGKRKQVKGLIGNTGPTGGARMEGKGREGEG